MPLRDHWWCILVAIFGAILFTEIGAVVITDYTNTGQQLIFLISFNVLRQITLRMS
jgi:hypothetical protein